jgi:hypothetical protein
MPGALAVRFALYWYWQVVQKNAVPNGGLNRIKTIMAQRIETGIIAARFLLGLYRNSLYPASY